MELKEMHHLNVQTSETLDGSGAMTSRSSSHDEPSVDRDVSRADLDLSFPHPSQALNYGTLAHGLDQALTWLAGIMLSC